MTPWPRLVRGDWRSTHRLILATYVDATPPYLADLADSDDEITALSELAAATNTRLLAQGDRAALALGAHELVYDVDWSQVINAAFAYPGQGGRFHGATRGAWYAGLDVSTSLAEVAFHRAVALAEIDRWEDEADYQDFVCDLGGDHFADLRDQAPEFVACLDPDSYVAGQQLADVLLGRGAAGVIWPSVRDSDGTCVVCFRPALVPPVSQGRRYRLTWSGSTSPTILEVRPPG